MRRQTPIAHALYNYLFPHPLPSDPPSFAAHLARNLVPEVRIEVATFYGDLNSVEARYPGLNYCHPPHRMRLGRFKHHRRLFEAFDALGLTYQEIQDFCCWEGSRWARLKYEEDQGEKVLDTTGDEIDSWVDRRHAGVVDERRRPSITRKTDISVMVEDAFNTLVAPPRHSADPVDEDMPDHTDVEHVHGQQQSPRSQRRPFHSQTTRHVNQQQRLINQQIIEAWEQGRALPPEIEAIIKEQAERGELTSHALHSLINAGRTANPHRRLPALNAGARVASYDARAAA